MKHDVLKSDDSENRPAGIKSSEDKDDMRPPLQQQSTVPMPVWVEAAANAGRFSD